MYGIDEILDSLPERFTRPCGNSSSSSNGGQILNKKHRGHTVAKTRYDEPLLPLDILKSLSCSDENEIMESHMKNFGNLTFSAIPKEKKPLVITASGSKDDRRSNIKILTQPTSIHYPSNDTQDNGKTTFSNSISNPNASSSIPPRNDLLGAFNPLSTLASENSHVSPKDPILRKSSNHDVTNNDELNERLQLQAKLQNNLMKNVDRLITKLKAEDIKLESDVAKKVRTTPTCLHFMFNTLARSLPAMMERCIPEEKQFFIELGKSLARKLEESPLLYAHEWKKEVEHNREVDEMLHQNQRIYWKPSLRVLEVMQLDNNWDKLSLEEKVNFWNKLRQMQTILDLMDIIPEEILISMTSVVYGTTTMYGGTMFDKVTESILQNDVMLYGIQKLASRVNLILKPFLPTAPSYVSLEQKYQTYDF